MNAQAQTEQALAGLTDAHNTDGQAALSPSSSSSQGARRPRIISASDAAYASFERKG
jgi:hypothetical protein